LKDSASPYLVLFIVDADCATAERGDGLLIVGGKLGIGLGPGVNPLLKLRDGHCVRDDVEIQQPQTLASQRTLPDEQSMHASRYG
jgi:hypothetical protein